LSTTLGCEYCRRNAHAQAPVRSLDVLGKSSSMGTRSVFTQPIKARDKAFSKKKIVPCDL
jgi:hypothetical protein